MLTIQIQCVDRCGRRVPPHWDLFFFLRQSICVTGKQITEVDRIFITSQQRPSVANRIHYVLLLLLINCLRVFRRSLYCSYVLCSSFVCCIFGKNTCAPCI